jgi:hypothetical protein
MEIQLRNFSKKYITMVTMHLCRASQLHFAADTAVLLVL